MEPLLKEPALHEIVVVSDGSTDGTVETVQRISDRDTRIRIVETAGQGPAQARLAGAEIATGEILLFLDDDITASAGLVNGHATQHALTEHLVLVGYMPVVPRLPGEYAAEIYAREYERHCLRWETDPHTVLRTLWAGNMSVRRSDFLLLRNQLHRIDSAGYHEDLELGLWLHKLGLTGAFDRRLRATHRYMHSPEKFLRDARSSGASLVHAHAVHGDLLGPLPADFAVRGLPKPARWIVSRARTKTWPQRVLMVSLSILGRLRMFTIERHVALLLKRVLQQEAALDTWQGAVHADNQPPL